MVIAFLRPEELVFGNLQKIAQTEDLKASRERILHMVDRGGPLSWEGELTLDYTGCQSAPIGTPDRHPKGTPLPTFRTISAGAVGAGRGSPTSRPCRRAKSKSLSGTTVAAEEAGASLLRPRVPLQHRPRRPLSLPLLLMRRSARTLRSTVSPPFHLTSRKFGVDANWSGCCSTISGPDATTSRWRSWIGWTRPKLISMSD
jgi:hypothetical protein